MGIGSFPVPVCDTTPGLGHNCIRDAGFFSKYHNTGIDILDMQLIYRQGENRCINQRINNDFDIIEKQADGIHNKINKKVNLSHT